MRRDAISAGLVSCEGNLYQGCKEKASKREQSSFQGEGFSGGVDFFCTSKEKTSAPKSLGRERKLWENVMSGRKGGRRVGGETERCRVVK